MLSRWRASSPSEGGRLDLLKAAVKSGCVGKLCDIQEQQQHDLDPDEFIIAKQEYWNYDRNIVIKGTIFLMFLCSLILFEELGVINCFRNNLPILLLWITAFIVNMMYLCKNAKPKKMNQFIVTNKRIYFSVTRYIDINKMIISNFFIIYLKNGLHTTLLFHNERNNINNIVMPFKDALYIIDIISYVKNTFSYITYIYPVRYSFEECKLKRKFGFILHILALACGAYGKIHISDDKKFDKRFSSKKDAFIYLRKILYKSNKYIFHIYRNYLKNRKEDDCLLFFLECNDGFRKYKSYFTTSSIYIMRNSKKLTIYHKNQSSEFPLYDANEHFLLRHSENGKDTFYKIPKKSLSFPFLDIVEMIYGVDVVMLNTIDIYETLFGWIWRS